MSEFSDFLIECFRNYNIWFLGIIIVLQCIGIPTGASLVVIASGAFAYAGEFNVVVILFEVWFFAWLGDNISYIMWKIIGGKILNRHIKIRKYFDSKISKAENYLNKYGRSTVFFTRFIMGAMGPFVNAAAGITQYKLWTFSLFVALGELFWTCIYLGLGYWFGDSWESIVPIVTQFGQFLTYMTILIIVLYFFIKLVRNKKHKTNN
ncbi:DedA family protein [Clostridium lacusfryxellense]|uniref:DedA family protein n=1 Tax=Clostridium lacusfryxellense TaxID=205328 RepID=UPI001C0D03F5|nr:DedA family protein [Clostridium lacusfryxellense]MBU3113534.1 DedA family protein [Clostridium lacusfryxellense]